MRRLLAPRPRPSPAAGAAQSSSKASSKNQTKRQAKKANKNGKQKQKQKTEKSLYFPAPPPEPVPPDFKGVHVDIARDLMGKDTPVQERLRKLCKDVPVPSARFKRAPSDYYNWTLEQRRDLLGAPHIDYLCKTMIMRNTRSKAENCADRTDSKYYMVVIQYTARMHRDKLNRLVQYLRPKGPTRMSKKQINLRVASAEEGVTLSGYGHNAVTPLGMAVSIPMIVSHRVLKLPYIWLGGGEVDVKLAMSVPDLCRVFKPIIGDLTYDA